ncbi:MAG TPA: M17 family peptidase N-terminal domain-containing protein, partial [Gemmatimonadaceae bacterium]
MTLSLAAERGAPASLDVPLLVIALAAGTALDEPLVALDRLLGGAIDRLLGRRDFRAGRDEALHLAGGATGPARILLIGIGKTERVSGLRRAGALAARQAGRMGAGRLAFYAGTLDQRETEAVALGLNVGAWEYTDTKTPPPDEERRAPLTSAVILGADAAGLDDGRALAEGHGLARTLGMMPGNLCTPDFLADTA